MSRAGRGALAALAALLASTPAAPASAQAPAGTATRFLTRSRFHLDAASIRAGGDKAFRWDTNAGGDVDLVDFGRGRFNILANYEAILGAEFRPFDPNQSRYVIELGPSFRLAGSEIAGIFHHTSRHLSDRPKRIPIDWNSLGVEFTSSAMVGRMRVDALARAATYVQRSLVDYTWDFGTAAAVTYPITPRLSGRASGRIDFTGTDDNLPLCSTIAAAEPCRPPDREGVLVGARGEVAFRVLGDGGALDLFMAVERRIDADPLARRSRDWLLMGFRLRSR